MRAHALVGAALWLAAWFLPLQSTSGMPLLERVVLLGVLVVSPLGYNLALAGKPAWTRHAWWPAAGCAASSFWIEPGDLSAALAGAWVLYTASVALVVAVARLRRLSWTALPGLLVDGGVVQLVVGAAWLVLARRGGAQLGFDAATVLLTAIHFHFAGFAVAVLAGWVGALDLGRLRRVYVPAAVVLATGPMWVALGIVVDDRLQVVSALLLAASVLVVGALLGLKAAPWAARAGARVSALLFGLAALILVGTMSLATVFALTEFAGHAAITIPEMALTHGLGNALGFGLGGLLAITLAPRPPEASTRGIDGA